jgi:hypothetical protein
VRVRDLFLILLAIPIASACASAAAPRSGLTAYATARAGCTQEDLPALIISVRPPNRPGTELRFEIAGPPAGTTQRRYRLSQLRRDPIGRATDLARAELRRNGQPIGWLSGEIVLERIARDNRAIGSYRVVGSDGAPFAGRFSASREPGPARCG